ncbi:MAG: hypothetical protein RLZZ401_1319, partial [Pseudomonadota bacterium]
MKRVFAGFIGLIVLAAAATVLAYVQRSFGGLLVGLALGLAALCVLARPARPALTLLISLLLGLALVEFAL